MASNPYHYPEHDHGHYVAHQQQQVQQHQAYSTATSPTLSNHHNNAYTAYVPPSVPQAHPQNQYQQHHQAPAPIPSTSYGVSRESNAGPSRSMAPSHRRDYSINGNGGALVASSSSSASAVASARGGGPYARPVEPINGPSNHNVKASSTTSEFTKRKNWSQHIIDEIQDFMHVLAPSGNFMFASPSVTDLAGWAPEDLVPRPFTEFVHPDDVEGYRREFHASLSSGQPLTIYCRFRAKDDRYLLFEITGHPYFAEYNGQQNCKCFFGMARPYPSKNQAMLDSFLELKFENERLRQELQVMYREIESGTPGQSSNEYRVDIGNDRNGYDGYSNGSPDFQRNGSFDSRSSIGVVDPNTGLVQTNGLIPSSSNTYGALGIGISTTGTKGDGSGDKKKKKPRVEEGEFVCRDCGTVDSPEWRKGPEGPKSLCNACGLRYAKLTSRKKKEGLA